MIVWMDVINNKRHRALLPPMPRGEGVRLAANQLTAILSHTVFLPHCDK